MYSNHDPPGSYNYPSVPSGAEPQGTPKASEAGSLVMADVPPSFPMQSPVRYTQDNANPSHHRQQYTESQIEVLHTLAAHTPAPPTSGLRPINTNVTEHYSDEQLALFHTAAHYSPTPEHPDGPPRSPAIFREVGERDITPVQRAHSLPPLTITVPANFAFSNVAPYPDNAPSPSPIDNGLDQDMGDTHSVIPTPSGSPANAQEDLPDTQRLDDFLKYIRFPALPDDIIKQNVQTELADLDSKEQAIATTVTELKRGLNDVVAGYSNYYLGPEISLQANNNMPFGDHEVNTALKVVLICLDAGMTSIPHNSYQITLNTASWFRATHAIMGAIIRGLQRTPKYRTMAKHSLNGVKDHFIVARGLSRPLTHAQLMQAMAEQLQRLTETRPELDPDHVTNIYDKAIGHVGTTIHNVLLNQALGKVTDKERASAKAAAMAQVEGEYAQLIKKDPEAMNIFNMRLVNKVLDSFQDESRADIEEWREVWLRTLTDAMKGQMTHIPVEGISSQIIRQNVDVITHVALSPNACLT